MANERSPLLPRRISTFEDEDPNSFHRQFCLLTGVPPSNLTPGSTYPKPGPKTLYGRAQLLKSSTNRTYIFTATISNSLLLTQVVLGAALTGLGASESSHVLITVFGALNTIIAGLVAYLKSRGQPMRARMFRDDLERVVDEMVNSETMWLGISKHVHGYDEIDTFDEVTVRSEIARLTRLYDRAVRNNSLNNPDMYMAGGPFDGAPGAGQKPRTQPSQPGATDSTPAQPNPPAPNIDQSPAMAAPRPPTPPPAPTPKPEEPPAAHESVAGPSTTATPSVTPAPAPGIDVPKPETASSSTVTLTPTPAKPQEEEKPSTTPPVVGTSGSAAGSAAAPAAPESATSGSEAKSSEANGPSTISK